MKKSFVFLFLVVLSISCSEDIQFNSPAFQGVIEGVFWGASSSNASLDPQGILKISGLGANFTIQLNTSSTAVGTYTLGENDINTAIYLVDGIVQYSTGTDRGDGEIVITDYDATLGQVSGTFRLNAENNDQEVLNLQDGVFFKVPLINAGIGPNQ